MIKRKLTSQTGASITYALLLFLVCAVVSTVVLAAGTAASGRMSKAVANDQRYYTVTSAAEYIKDQLDGKTWVQRTVEGSVPTTDGGVDANSVLNAFSKLIADGEAFPEKLILGISGHDELKVEIVPVLSGDTLTLTLSSSDSNGTYTLEMAFSVENPPAQTLKNASSKDVTVKQVIWNLYSIRTIAASETSDD